MVGTSTPFEPRNLRSAGRCAGWALPWILAVLLVACGPGLAAHPTAPLSPPPDREARQRAIDAFGQRAWDALAAGVPQRLLFDELDLRAVLDTTAASRFSARRGALAHLGPTDDFPPLLASAEYAGVCLQGARAEEAGGVLGLLAEGWVFDRALVIGRRPTGRRVAAWIEGAFLYTDAGFGALDIERVEQPRWEHSDLEIAPCDLAVRNDLPVALR